MNIEKEMLVLVDKNNNKIGLKEKIQTHIDGDLHRAVSVLIFNPEGKILLQKRALDKYHCPGIWSNTCCTHPFENESGIEAASRRLNEEMGIESELIYTFSFIYRAEFDNGLIEHEYDDVFLGTCSKDPKINLEEVADYKWIDLNELYFDIKDNSEKYSKWFLIILEKYNNKLEEYLKSK